MGLQGREMQRMVWGYIQLRNMIRWDSASKSSLMQKLEAVDGLVYRELPEVLRQDAPPCAYEWLADFHGAYEQFKDFAAYQSLAGKLVVGLGGGFSSGKTSFLNALMGAGKILPEGIRPSAAVPTYLVHGSETAAKAINAFGSCVSLEVPAINSIGHGFGAGENEEKQDDGKMPLGHILKNLVLETNLQKYENLVFFDTPGHSDLESGDFRSKTGGNAARQQLNSADFILWFLSVKNLEALPTSDIKLLKSIHPEIPIAVICSNANQRTQAQRTKIKAKIEDQVLLENLNVDKVFFFDADTPKGLNSFGIHTMLADWNKLNCDQDQFARRLKKIFSECRAYYKRKQEEAKEEIQSLTDALLWLEQQNQTAAGIKQMKEHCQREMALAKQQEEEMLRIQTVFFKEIREAASEFGIHIPENVDDLEDKIENSLQILKHYNMRHKNQADPEIRQEILHNFQEIQPVFDCEPGGNKYRRMAFDILDEIAFPHPEEIRFDADLDSGMFS